MKKLLMLMGMFALAACSSTGGGTPTPTPQTCAQQEAELSAVQQSLPNLEAAVESAIAISGGNQSDQRVVQARAALELAEVSVTTIRAFVAAQCVSASG